MVDKVSYLIHNYEGLVAKRNTLVRMLQRLEGITPDEILVYLNYQHDAEVHVDIDPSLKDRTAKVALNYHKEFYKIYEQEYRDCFRMYDNIDRALVLLDSSIDNLPKQYKEFMEKYLYERKTWDCIALECNISRRSVEVWQKKSIKLIAEMFMTYDGFLPTSFDFML